MPLYPPLLPYRIQGHKKYRGIVLNKVHIVQWCGVPPFALCKENNIIFVYDDDDDDNGNYNDNDDLNAVACLHLDMQGK